MEKPTKKIEKLKFEISVDYDEGKGPFNNRQIIGKIRNALRFQVGLMDEDGSFGKYQGNTAKVNVKLKKIECKGDKDGK